MKPLHVLALLVLCLFFCTDCRARSPEGSLLIKEAGRRVSRKQVLDQNRVPVYTWRMVEEFPHDPTSFTEGLVMEDGLFYEGTGIYGESRLRRVEPGTGRVLKEVPLDERYFGEGVTLLGDEIFQLTYLSHIGFVYDKKTFGLKRTFHYPNEGWGLATDGERLILSNGSAVMAFLDPESGKRLGEVVVSDPDGPVDGLNELEYVKGSVFANIYRTNLIARIDAATGGITGWIDLSGLNPDPKTLHFPSVPNGIAWNKATNRLLVTGKYWPGIFEIELVPVGNMGRSGAGQMPPKAKQESWRFSPGPENRGLFW